MLSLANVFFDRVRASAIAASGRHPWEKWAQGGRGAVSEYVIK